MLFVMTSGDLNIDLTQKVFFLQKLQFFQRAIKRRFAVCRYDSFFFRSEGEPKRFPRPISRLSEPTRNRAESESVRQLRAGRPVPPPNRDWTQSMNVIC